jgi:hypothetical protein
MRKPVNTSDVKFGSNYDYVNGIPEHKRSWIGLILELGISDRWMLKAGWAGGVGATSLVLKVGGA